MARTDRATAGLVHDRRVRRLEINSTLLTRMFVEGNAWEVAAQGLPADVKFCSLTYDLNADMLSVYLASASWEPYAADADIPQVVPELRQMPHSSGE